MKWYDIRIWKWVMVVAIVLTAVFTMTGCRSKEYVTVPEIHTEYVHRVDTVAKMDSVYVKDSVYVYRSGDTVMVRKVTYRDRWRNIYKVKVDTIIKRDSVSVPYPVSRELSMKDKIALRFWTYTPFILVLGLIVCAAVWTFYWYRNKKC